MAIASLIVWILTAGGGAFMLAKWVRGGGHRASTASRLPPAVVFGHFVLAAVGLVLWIVYGFFAGSLPVVIFSSINLLLSITILVLTIRNSPASEAHRA